MPAAIAEMTFAEKLRQLKEEAGISTRELADRAGLPFATVDTYFQGYSEPLLSNARKIARALGKDLSVFDDCIDPPVGRPAKKRRGNK